LEREAEGFGGLAQHGAEAPLANEGAEHAGRERSALDTTATT
jgi:hypothetical protein